MGLPNFVKALHEANNIKSLARKLGVENPSLNVEKMTKNKDFLDAFVKAVPAVEQQKKYFIQTSAFDHGKEYDPEYVLYFRRTLSSDVKKHEERWTNDFNTVLNGLRHEIPKGPHRYHSVILCDTLAHITIHGIKSGENAPFTDGEIVVQFPEYDQKMCLCSFKPEHEKKELDAYLQSETSLTKEQILNVVRDMKGYSK